MFDFSDKYNLKINSVDNIIDLISNFDEIVCKDEFKVSELYFINKNIDISKIENFNDISDYAVIVNNNDKKFVKLYNKDVYQAKLDDVLIISELLLMYEYEILFSITRKIHKYLYKNIEFYIEYINNKTFVLTFKENVNITNMHVIIDLFKCYFKIDLDNNMNFNIKEQLFLELKK